MVRFRGGEKKTHQSMTPETICCNSTEFPNKVLAAVLETMEMYVCV